jgi:Tol biopolymer transport system component
VLLTDSVIDLGGVSWGYDGYIYADTKLEGDGFGRVPESGGPPEPVTMPAPGEGWHSQPFALPNGRGVIYYVSGGDRIAVVDLDSGDTRILVDGIWAGYANSGHLLWLSQDGMLMAQRFDPDSFELSGRAVPLTESVAAALDFGGGNVALSASGDLVYVEGDVSNEEMVLAWVDRAGTETLLDSTWVRPFRGLDVSPDGSQIVAAVQEGEEAHLWVRPSGDGPQRKLTFDGSNRDPIWLPDGEWIGYVREDGIFRRRADGSGGAVRVADGELPRRPQWTRDGAWVVYDDATAVWGQPLDEGGLAVGERVKLVDDPNVFDGLARVSPDGRWISFVDLSEGEARVYVRPFPNTDDGLWLITEGSSMGATWSSDGRQLVFRAGDPEQLQVVDILPGESFAHSAPRALFSLAGYRWPNLSRGLTALTPDAERFLLLKHPGAEVPERLIYVQNIFRVLEDQVGN